VAWDGNQRLQARFISPAGKPGPVLSLGDGGLQLPQVAISHIWQSCVMPVPGALSCSGPFLIWGRLVAATGGGFGRRFTLTSDGIYPVFGESWAGKLTAAWVQPTGSTPIRARFGP
jgi:hypothetical protein